MLKNNAYFINRTKKLLRILIFIKLLFITNHESNKIKKCTVINFD